MNRTKILRDALEEIKICGYPMAAHIAQRALAATEVEAAPVTAGEIKTHEDRLVAHGFVNHEHNCDLYRAEIAELRAVLAERGTVGEPDFHIGVAVEPNGTYVQVFDGEKRMYGQFHEMPHPAPASDGGLPVQVSFEDWCATKGLTPERCDETNFWIRQAYEDAQRSHAAPQVAQVVAGGLTDAAIAWWKHHRPLSWNEARHIRNPKVNCQSGPDNELAVQVAAILAAKETTS